MRVTFQQTIKDEDQESVTLGEIEFLPLPGRPDLLSIEEYALHCADQSQLVVSAAYSPLNHNFSMFIKIDGKHIFTGMCHWHAVAPYFAFRLTDGSLIECYFAK